MLTKNDLRNAALHYGADLFGVGDISLFAGTNPQRDPMKILPKAKSILGFGFRVPRGLYTAMEQKTQFLNYTSLGVKSIDEELSEIFLLKMAGLIENEGYDACVQRNICNLKIKGDKSQNPEVLDTYELVHAEAVAPGLPVPDVIIDFAQAAEICGLGKIGRSGKILTPQFGPFVRFVFIITDMPLEADAPFTDSLCDGCNECAEACPGNAIDENGLDTWQCSVYYRGAHRSNPLQTEDFLKDYPDREAILDGTARFDAQSARKIYPYLNFLPSKLTGYSPCLCGKKCDVACYRHLKKEGKLK